MVFGEFVWIPNKLYWQSTFTFPFQLIFLTCFIFFDSYFPFTSFQPWTSFLLVSFVQVGLCCQYGNIPWDYIVRYWYLLLIYDYWYLFILHQLWYILQFSCCNIIIIVCVVYLAVRLGVFGASYCVQEVQCVPISLLTCGYVCFRSLVFNHYFIQT